MQCVRCGYIWEQEMRYCGQCGEPMHAKHSSYTAAHTAHAGPGASPVVADDDLSAFVGIRYDEYRRKWRQGSQWNWPAALLDIYWLLYRKMYAYCVIFILAVICWVGLLATMFKDVRPAGPTIAIAVALCLIPKLVLAMIGNKLYLHHAKEKIAGIRNLPFAGEQDEDDRPEDRIAEAGGTTWAVPLTAFVAPMIIMGLIGLIVALQYMNKTVESIDLLS